MWTIDYAIWKVIIRKKLYISLDCYHPPANVKDKNYKQHVH